MKKGIMNKIVFLYMNCLSSWQFSLIIFFCQIKYDFELSRPSKDIRLWLPLESYTIFIENIQILNLNYQF